MKAKDVKTLDDFKKYLHQIGAIFDVSLPQEFGTRSTIVRVYYKDAYDKDNIGGMPFIHEYNLSSCMNVFVGGNHWFISENFVRPDNKYQSDHVACYNYPKMTKEEICLRAWRMSRKGKVAI